MSHAPSWSPLAAFLSRGSVYVTGVVAQIVVAAIALPIVTRLVDPSVFGLIAAALLVTNLLAVVVDLGLSRAVLRCHYRVGEGPRQARSLLSLALVAAIVTTALADLLGPWWIRVFADVPYAVPLRLAVWTAAAVAIRNATQAVLRANDRTGWHVTTALLSTAGGQVLGVLLLWRTDGGVASYMLGLALGALAAAVLGLAIAKPRLRGLLDRRLVGWAMRFAAPTVPAELAAVAIWFVDRVVIERLAGLEAVARYQIAYTVGSVVLMMAMGASQAWAPLIHGEPASTRVATTQRTLAVFTEVAAYAVAGLALASPLALMLLAPATYDPVPLVGVVAVVALAALPLIRQQAATHLLADRERTTVLATRGLAAVALNIGLNVALAPRWGLMGAAMATVLTYLGYAWSLGRAARRVAGFAPGKHGVAWAIALAGVAAGSLLPAEGTGLTVRLAGTALLALALARAVRRLLGTPRRDDAPIVASA